ncbi:pilus (MSHA type) biogenesis protein MshL [Colwellia sp. MB02u-18]|nr:pilus (MSHA type) biogenesis protein MshL [Colwellia sp. MB3u-45]MBA6268451.1 pilus (MSHA type) biogenesis protein MshL [Colwellia sp. MB3u-43]MBA6319902.1 pilus (MSHA type) biogenesis protein MshL [Colwellia sp. MB02u-19]MBA6324554.1 pilus (MSHA type) biogenesis protein MshL [Colwellia sp. MB02u-18]MBA6330709.1 pilus (MSHA type) biogenesis protein MshL [Colwellia sp. MB02u-12]MBA6346225.1 pilus (MSHA type) biogenesis protein MshL [Colwellia sp. MB02u-1]
MKLLCCSAILVLVGCQSAPKPPTDVTQALDKAIAQANQPAAPKPLQALPNSVRQELMQKEIQQARHGLLAEKRLEIAASGVAAEQFLAAIVDDSPYSIAVHPDVTGTITLNLKNVTLDETLDVIESLYGYDIRREGRVIQVYPAGIRTETIPLDYLYVKRSGISSTSVNSGGVSGNDSSSGNSSGGSSNNGNSGNSGGNNGSNSSNQSGSTSSGVNIYTENESDFWSELQVTLSALVGSEDGRSVIVSPQAGLITIKAMPAEITAVKRFIESTEEHLRRQVIIEAKIMEVTLNDDYQQGVKWDQVLGHIESTNINFSTTGNIANNAIASAIGGVTNLSFLNKDFSGVIELLSTQGNVQVLSSPRITATNNQKAIIKVGEDEYFVTDVSSTTTTGTSTTTTPEIDLTPFFSGIALDVTPQIDADGEVILHVHPSVTITDEQTKTIRLSDQDIILPLAQSSVRESDTIIRAKSGEIVVIGGLIETRKVDLESKTPFFGDIPIVGALFKSKSESVQKKELVILLKPIVIGQDTWKNQLQDARALLKQWFPEDADAASN